MLTKTQIPKIFLGRYAAEHSTHTAVHTKSINQWASAHAPCALVKWLDMKGAEYKAEKLCAESNRLNPEPKFDQEAAPAEKKYKDAAMDP